MASITLALLLPLFLLGCGREGRDGSVRAFRVDEVPTPAGAGSEVPHLAVADGRAVLSWLETNEDAGHTLWMDVLGDAGWNGRRVVVSSQSFFVNWADFPSVIALEGGDVLAHWLLRGETGGYDYGVRTAVSQDEGRSWSRPWTPHSDDTPTEHGFVSSVALNGGGYGLVWLDGRDFALHGNEEEEGTARAHEHPEGPEMSLRFRSAGGGAPAGREQLLDGRVCDCCQTDMIRTADGLLVAYRDRSPREVRDVYVIRRTAAGWTEPVPVHDDGWVFPACPVNGPAAAARNRRVAVAWFTGARDTARVRVAFSSDGGASFGAPVRVDEGNPAGRVDVVLTDENRAVVSWLERTDEGAHVRLRPVTPDGEVGSATTVARSSEGRASGFPQMVRTGPDALVLAWTDVRGDEPRVRVARVRLSAAAGEEGRRVEGPDAGGTRRRP